MGRNPSRLWKEKRVSELKIGFGINFEINDIQKIVDFKENAKRSFVIEFIITFACQKKMEL